MIQELGVVTPVYSTKENSRLEYFKNTAGSVLTQNYDFLWVVVDDGSTDNTRDFVRSIKDPRIVLLERKRLPGDKKTSSNALNLGINYLFENGCRYFAYVHSDDLLPRGSLELRVNGLKDNDMVYGRIALLKGKQLFYQDFSPKGGNYCSPALMESGFPHHTSMWSRRMIDLMRKGRENQVFDRKVVCAEDMDVTLYCKSLMIEEGLSLGFVDRVVYIWVNSEGNITQHTSRAKGRRQIKRIYEKVGFENPVAYSWVTDYIRRPFFWLPEPIKEPLRPLRELVKQASKGLLFPDSSLKPSDMDPYWFKKE